MTLDRAEPEPVATGRLDDLLDAELQLALERYARELGPEVSRATALREVVRAWARENGYLPEAEGIRPEDLNSANDG